MNVTVVISIFIIITIIIIIINKLPYIVCIYMTIVGHLSKITGCRKFKSN